MIVDCYKNLFDLINIRIFIFLVDINTNLLNNSQNKNNA